MKTYTIICFYINYATAINKDTIVINKDYLKYLEDIDLARALFYHEVGHLINYRRVQYYKLVICIGVSLFAIGLFLPFAPSFLLVYLDGARFIALLLIPIGMLAIRYSMKNNEYIADAFAARELGLNYYIQQLNKLRNLVEKDLRICRNRLCRNIIVFIVTKIIGYPSIDQRIKYLAKLMKCETK